MIHTVTTVLAVIFLVCIPVAYLMGRRSSVDEAVDRRLAQELYQPPVILMTDQERADRAEAEGDDG